MLASIDIEKQFEWSIIMAPSTAGSAAKIAKMGSKIIAFGKGTWRYARFLLNLPF